MSDLQGKTGFVFGATGGMGENLARRLSRRGMRLFLAARQADRLQHLAQELAADCLVLDATSFTEVENGIRQAQERFGALHAVAHCVGSLLLKPAHLTSEAEWHATLNANLSSAFAVVRSSVSAMTEGGSIILVSSAAAKVGLANHEAIAAAKAGILGLVRSAAATYAPRGIRINCVSPGLVRTPLTARITASESSLKYSTALHALGRIGEPDDVCSMIEWLLSPAGQWATGQDFAVDGGLSTVRVEARGK